MDINKNGIKIKDLFILIKKQYKRINSGQLNEKFYNSIASISYMRIITSITFINITDVCINFKILF